MSKKSKSAKNVEKQKTKSASKKSTKSWMSIAKNTQKSVEDRVAALAGLPFVLCENDDDIQAVLKVISDENEPIEVRLAALQTLQAASFSVVTFESCRKDYIATLRQITKDKDLELRQRALGILARENDGFAQQELIEGLEHPEKALVPPEKALQLLSYDIHTEAYPIAHKIIKDPPNAAAKREALRLLAGDATSAPIFEEILRDKNETYEIRQISASALHAVEPEKLQENVREILLDKSEPEDIQGLSLTALTQFGDAQKVSDDKPLLRRVNRLSGNASEEIKQRADQFLDKYLDKDAE